MPELQLNLLGPFEAFLGDQPLYGFRTNKVQALLIYLVCERDHPHRREALMELLWPDMPLESAQVNLRQTIYRLKQEIPEVRSIKDEQQVDLILSDRQTAQINPEASVQLDVDVFLENIENQPELAVKLYRGDFLSDFYLVDSSQFEEWAESWREKLRRNVLATLAELAQACIQKGKYDDAQAYAWQQIEIDRVNEPAYRQLMTALANSGQRNAALSLFQNLEHRLQKELDVKPEAETVQLYEQIQADEQRVETPAPPLKAASAKISIPVFLLTDIEGSTRLWDKHRQAMLTALLQHNAILEEQISRYGGRILEERGDGVVAVFERGDPLSAVLEIQKAFAKADWGEIGDMRIRIGLHGVPSVRKDFDYFERDQMYYGPVLHHTARVMDAGWGGQILLSERVHNAFSLPPGASWIDYGLHNLKSLDQQVHIYGLYHPDLPQKDFPPLRTLTNAAQTKPTNQSRPRHNLIPQSTPFIGRIREQKEIEELLADPQKRLVSIVGPGGMGKTRLAMAIAERLIEGKTPPKNYLFPNGVYFISLVSLTEPDQIISAIVKSLNVSIEASQGAESLERSSQTTTTTTQKENLIGYLQGKRILLILDNFEHLLDGAEVITGLLEAVPTIQIMVTSRERLHIREEQVYNISGLEFPDWEAPTDPGKYTAMELFLQSAHRVQPDFRLEADDMLYLTRICRLVGGMPLGLELAASWVGMLSIAEIASEIQRCIDFLETDLRNIPDRHRSLRAVFDSSWRALGEGEKRTFARLSIFRGSFTRSAAESVSNANLRTLANLVSKSLLQFERETNRYQIHELLRQYGAEQLATNSEQEHEAFRKHSVFYCSEVVRHLETLMSGQLRIALEQMELDFANIRIAWNWAVAHDEIELVSRALDGICLFFDWNWQPDEALTVCRQALEAVSAQESSRVEDTVIIERLQAKVLNWEGYFSLYYSADQATDLLNQSCEIVDQLLERGIDARKEKCQIDFNQGLLKIYLLGDMPAAKAHFEESLELSREIGFQWMILRNLIMLGNVVRRSGAPSEAKLWYGQCLAESRALNNRWGEIDALDGLGWAARSLGSYQEARSHYEESYQIAKDSGHRWEMANALESLGFLSIFLGEYNQALERFHEAIAISEDLGMPYRSMPSRIHVGVASWLAGDFAKAESAILDSVSISAELTPASRIFPTICQAEYYTITGRYREAHAQFRLLDTLTGDVFLDRFLDGRLKRTIGWMALAETNYDLARQKFQESVELYRVDSDDEQVAWSQVGLAAAAIHQEKWEEAHQILIEALWTCIEIRAFIPLLFLMPIACLYLARENSSLAGRVFTQIRRSDFLCNAKIFYDIAYKHLPEEIVQQSNKSINPLSGADLRQHMWSTASNVLSSWIQVWMEDTETVQI